MPWRYQDSSALDSYPIWGASDLYHGGGYAVEFFPKWNNTKTLATLKEKKWIDRYSRAVIIEFALFNPTTNLFNSVAIVFELPPSGGVVHFYSVLTFSLYRATVGNVFFVTLCEITYFIFILFFCIREARLLYKTGASYFKSFWNLVEVSILLLSMAAAIFYFYRTHLAKTLLKRVPGKKPDIFINFQFAAIWDLSYTYIVALIVFFVMLKFINLLRFNKRVSMLAKTLRVAWHPLAMFGMILGTYLIL